MTDVAVDVSGEMDIPPEVPKGQFARFLPAQLPDPKQWLFERRAKIRHWFLFLQTSNFKPPPSIPRLSRRLVRNIEYFQSNYLFVFLGLVAYCLITSPLLLFAIVAAFYACYRLSKRNETQKTVVFGHELSLAQQYAGVFICSLPVFYLVGAGAVLFWVLGASLLLITLHAAFYNIDAVVTEDDGEFPVLQQV